MVDANEFIELQNGQKDEQDFKLATVTDLFETGTAKIQFYGEDAPSEKEYSYLASYSPTVDDVVLVAPFANTYIIVGKVQFQTPPNESGITADEMNAAITNALSEYAKLTDLDAYVKPGTSISSLSVIGTFTSGNYRHGTTSGSFLSFFGAPMIQKQSVSNISSSATSEQVRTGLINLISALKNYGLI